MRLSPGSVISGTLRPSDLLRRFAELLALHSAGGNEKLIQRANEVAKELEYTTHVQDDDEDLLIEAEEMIDLFSKKFNDLVPVGYFFGTHPGDVSDFGVWGFEEMPEDFWHPNKLETL